MLNKNRNGSKTLRFDEDNLRQTNHPMEKDYGLMSIPESKTPFPRNADPVEANELRRRLQEVIERANKFMMTSEGNSKSSLPTNESDCQRVSMDEELREKQRAEFLVKRKQFYKSEFLITKQKMLSGVMHPPGPSVGNRWRIDDQDEQARWASVISCNARIASIISRQRWRAESTDISSQNQEALREIAEQTTSRSHQPGN